MNMISSDSDDYGYNRLPLNDTLKGNPLLSEANAIIEPLPIPLINQPAKPKPLAQPEPTLSSGGSCSPTLDTIILDPQFNQEEWSSNPVTSRGDISPINQLSLDGTASLLGSIFPDSELDKILSPIPTIPELVVTVDDFNEATNSAEDSQVHLLTSEESDADMDLSKKRFSIEHSLQRKNVSDDLYAAEGLIRLSTTSLYPIRDRGDPLGSESESLDSVSVTTLPDESLPTIKIKLEASSSSAASGDGPKANGRSGRSSRRKRKKEFLHQKNDPTDPIAQRALYAKTYRERKKQEHETEVVRLKKVIAERDAIIKDLQVKNDKMAEQLTKATLSRHETIKFSENIASVVKAVSSTAGIDVTITPSLGELNSPKLTEQEVSDIVQKRLHSQRFSLQFDYSDIDKKLLVMGEPNTNAS